MITSTAENETAQATAAAKEPEAPKKAHTAARKPHVAPAKAKSGKKTTGARQGAKAPKKAATAKATGTRQGSKSQKMLSLLKRPGGASLKELTRATGWQPHSVRSFLSATVGKKLGLAVTSAKGEDGERSYSVKG